MTIYRGDSSKNFKINKAHRSRYGINALFFSTGKELARLYAIHRATENHIRNGGFVYESQIDGHLPSVDYGGGSSYSGKFRALIYQLYRENYTAARITNVLDFPSKHLMRPTGEDVIVVFDFERIKSFTLIEENLRGR